MSKLRWLTNTISHYKYLIVIVIGVAAIGFLDDESVVQRVKLDMQIDDMEAEINKYTKLYETDAARLQELKRDPRAVTKIAREQYFMKTDEEDIYVLSDDKTDDDGKQ